MKNININDEREAFSINGDPDRVIYVHATDFNIKVRANKARTEIGVMLEELDSASPENEEAFADVLENVDSRIREQINYIFDYNVSEPVFGACSPLMTLKNGKTYVEAFLDAFIPEIEKVAEKAAKASEKRINKHAGKYIKK